MQKKLANDNMQFYMVYLLGGIPSQDMESSIFYCSGQSRLLCVTDHLPR
ncbi:MAG: hypothetical protein PHG58_03555 [Clostridia bacterium]|nr:hypothetical protein [Clostridia bacterium]